MCGLLLLLSVFYCDVACFCTTWTRKGVILFTKEKKRNAITGILRFLSRQTKLASRGAHLLFLSGAKNLPCGVVTSSNVADAMTTKMVSDT